MYKITLTIENPGSQETRQIVRQFDPAAMTQAKWNAAYIAAVKPAIDELVAASATSEPPTW